MGFTEATEIQARSIPAALSGRDIIGFSQTGSGKTAAFGLPAIEAVDLKMNAKFPQVLIMSPTRELAMQVTDELRKFSKYTERMHIVPVYGGEPINRQIGQLRGGCQIVVGTPGRIMDHLGRRTLRFDEIKMVVLDEADEMLNMGFREDIETILEKTPESRQTLLFSATMPQEIINITGKYQKSPEMIKIKSKQMTAVNIEQSYFEVARNMKKDALSLLLQYYRPNRSIVFCNTKKMVSEVAADLRSRGFNADELHGDMKQSQRTQVMNRYKNGGIDILVATDVASRGIDVNDIDIVFNFDIPDETEYYVHRIGRTARAGKTGKSFTLVQGQRQLRELQSIAKCTHSTIEKKPMPLVSQIESENSDALLEEINLYAQSNDCSDCDAQLEKLRSLGYTDTQIAKVMLKMYLADRTLRKGTVDVPGFSADRSEFEERSPRARIKKRTPNERARKKFDGIDMERVTISIGRKDRVAPNHILGAVAGESGLPGSIMGTIDIRSNFTTIDVPKQYKTRIIKALNNKTIKGRKVTVK